MIVSKVLYIISITNILINNSSSIFADNTAPLYKYTNNSYPAVAVAHISITVILLSFEKSFSKYPPKETNSS